jgi:hypothetical protein
MSVGIKNPEADLVNRKDVAWSDTKFTRKNFAKDRTFNRLCCDGCGGAAFEVLSVGNYETVARCYKCGIYFSVHNG